MRVLDLFAGIGGFSLAAHWMGWETTAFCEKDKFCQKVLRKNFPNVPIHDDIRKIKEFTQYAGTVELISGGYPCQPFSVAGKQRGAEDDRHLWPSMLGIIKAVKPTWVVAENVYGHVSMGLDDVLSDLEAEGYTSRALIIPACAKDAHHRRDRVWIIAHANEQRTQILASGGQSSIKMFGSKIKKRGVNEQTRPVESRFCGSLDGISPALDGNIKIPNRNARIKALGNSIVPQVAFEIFKSIGEFDNESKEGK